MDKKSLDHILVIKLGALGDFVQALGPMAAIRKHHPQARITLLTTPLFEKFGRKCGYFDDVWIDTRPKFFDVFGWMDLKKRLTDGKFSRVYDLQNNDRTGFYLKLFPRDAKPEWVGAAKGASHRNISPERTARHAFDGHKQTLACVGIEGIEIDTLDWVKEDLSAFDLQVPYILFVPGSAPQHPLKRWPQEKYAILAGQLTKQGYQVVLLGTVAEKSVTDAIGLLCPGALNLTGKTSLFQIAALAHGGAGAIGNDTGPMHIIAATGCSCLSLFSGRSNPARHAPKGKNVAVLQEDRLDELDISLVSEMLDQLFSK